MTALYATVDMRAPGNMLTRPEPKLRDKIDALGLVKVLLAHKANPNARLKKPIIGRHQNLVGDASLAEGATALARASKAGDLPVIRLLLDGGADATLTLKDRTTTAMIAANGDARAEGARGGPAARRSRCRRQRVQRERADDPAQRRGSWGQFDRAVRRRPGRQARSPGQAESDRLSTSRWGSEAPVDAGAPPPAAVAHNPMSRPPRSCAS